MVAEYSILVKIQDAYLKLTSDLAQVERLRTVLLLRVASSLRHADALTQLLVRL